MHNLVLSPIDPNRLIDAIAAKVTTSVLSALNQHQEKSTIDNKRITDAAGLSKYLKRPLSAVYQMQHKGVLPAMRMPGSRRLYYDLDMIDALMASNEKEVSNA